MLLEKAIDARGDFFPVRLEREVPRVEKMGFHGLQISRIGAAPAGGKIKSFLPQVTSVGG